MGVRYTVHNQDEFIAYKLEQIAKEQNISRNQLINKVLKSYVMEDQRDEQQEAILMELKLIRETLEEGHNEAFEALMMFKKRMDFLNRVQGPK